MSSSAKRFSTFEGVFTPCLLSLLGVIMYLRLGWVVGSVGLAGCLSIIVLANLITFATALSMASVVTNIRIGAGGAYSIISKSLGLEAGGAIGIPLYASQAISIAFYITGFAECWHSVFASHNVLLISLIAWFILLVISYLSTKLAFKIQYVILFLIGMSLVSVIFGARTVNPSFSFTAGFVGADFWKVFAIFFPAVTGILAGASMSGELKDPKKSIPSGTIWAIALSFCFYIFLAVWFALYVPLDSLKSNSSIAIELGKWNWMVICGIMGATLSSGLAMFVGAPRVLLALSKHSIVPFSASFSRLSKKGEPAAAVLFTALISLATILCGSLDNIASLLTMFFLVTYGMINATVFIEQTIGIPSFRPTFSISKVIPLFGLIGCVVVMFLIDPKFSMIAIALIVIMYVFLIQVSAKFYSPDIRSGMLLFIAEKFAKAANRLPYYPKIWKPNLLFHVQDIEKIKNSILLLESIASPAGRVFAVRIIDENRIREIKQDDREDSSEEAENTPESILQQNLQDQLLSKLQPLDENGLFVSGSAIEARDVQHGLKTIIQTLKGAPFPPNTFFHVLSLNTHDDSEIESVINLVSNEGLGVVLLLSCDDDAFIDFKKINLWIRKHSPNIDLSVLISLQLEKNWDGQLRIVQLVANKEEYEDSMIYLNRLKEIMRLPLSVQIEIIIDDFQNVLAKAPDADINIFGMRDVPDISVYKEVYKKIKTPVLFLRDSGHESALA